MAGTEERLPAEVEPKNARFAGGFVLTSDNCHNTMLAGVLMAIQSITHRGLRRLYEDDDVRGIPANTADKLKKMMIALDTAARIDDVAKMPGWKLHPLTGDLAGLWSLTVTRNWRLVFSFDNGDASGLDLMDYH